MSEILILDAMVAKCQVSLDETYTKAMVSLNLVYIIFKKYTYFILLIYLSIGMFLKK